MYHKEILHDPYQDVYIPKKDTEDFGTNKLLKIPASQSQNGRELKDRNTFFLNLRELGLNVHQSPFLWLLDMLQL